MGLSSRYAIVKKIADGGMAEIFLAVQSGAEGFERKVIVKRILPASSADPQFRNMLVDEAHIAMTLAHSNIVQVLDLGEADGRYFLVMELVDGWDLATLLERARTASLPLPVPMALYVTAEVCRALAYAHTKSRNGKALGIVHRDISPQNILVSEHGEVKLTDFGIAKAMGKRERTQTGIIKGKLDFMSPEQATGTSLDARSDLFSLGSVLYLITTGVRPFEAASDLASLLRVQGAGFKPPSEVRPDLPASVTAIIERAMKRVPSERYPNAEAMMLALEEVLRAEHGSAGQSELKRWLTALGQRDRTPTTAGVPALPEDDLEGGQVTGRTLALVPERRRALALAETRLAAPAVPPSALTPGPESAPPARRRSARQAGARVAFAFLGAAAATIVLAPQKARDWLERGARAVSAAPALPAAEPRTAAPAAIEPQEVAAPLAIEPEGVAAAVAVGPEEIVEPEIPRPAPRAAPAASAVTVRIASSPKGAVVRTANGGVLGSTPLSLTLRSGTSHTFTVAKRGYGSVNRSLVVGRKDMAMTVRLEKPVARQRPGRARASTR